MRSFCRRVNERRMYEKIQTIDGRRRNLILRRTTFEPFIVFLTNPLKNWTQRKNVASEKPLFLNACFDWLRAFNQNNVPEEFTTDIVNRTNERKQTNNRNKQNIIKIYLHENKCRILFISRWKFFTGSANTQSHRHAHSHTHCIKNKKK